MKNYTSIMRLFEQDVMSAQDYDELGMQPEASEMPQAEAPMPALPAEGESSATMDPMTMTVGDFIAKCKEIDPLVCMGIESFIEKNLSAFGATAEPQAEPSQDLTFSNAVAPPQDEISFSGAVPPQGGAMAPQPAPTAAPQPASTFPMY